MTPQAHCPHSAWCHPLQLAAVLPHSVLSPLLARWPQAQQTASNRSTFFFFRLYLTSTFDKDPFSHAVRDTRHLPDRVESGSKMPAEIAWRTKPRSSMTGAIASLLYSRINLSPGFA